MNEGPVPRPEQDAGAQTKKPQPPPWPKGAVPWWGLLVIALQAVTLLAVLAR